MVIAKGPSKVDVAEGQETGGIELLAASGGIIRGRVYDNDSGKSIAGVTLDAFPEGFGPMRMGIASESDGTYEIRGLGKDTYEIRHQIANGYPQTVWAARKKVSVTPGQVYEGIDIPLDHGITLSGRVVDASGNGIVEVRVGGSGANGNMTDQAFTDAAGKFQIAGFLPGEILLEVHKEGSGHKSAGPFRVDDRGVEGVEIVLEAEAVIAGIVVDKHGGPVASAPVYIKSIGILHAEDNITTNADGAFRIAGLGSGEHKIELAKIAQYYWDGTAAKTVNVRAGEVLEGVRLVYDFSDGAAAASRPVGIDGAIEVFGMIAGRVVNSGTGEPVRAFELAHMRGNILVAHPNVATFQSLADEVGEFFLDNVAIGENTLLARAEGFVTDSIQVQDVHADETLGGVEIRLEQAAVIEGVVRDKRGGPVEGAMIFRGAVPEEYDRERAAVATTGAGGEFQIDTLAPGSTELHVYHPGYLEGVAALSLASTTENFIEIVLPDGGTIEGTVRVGGVPVEGVEVMTYDPEKIHSPPNSQKTDVNGRYRIARLVPATLWVSTGVTPGPAMGSRSMTKQAKVEEGNMAVMDFDFAHGDATVTGRLTQPGGPLASVWVDVMTGAYAEGGEGARTQTDSSGHYRIEGILPGAASIQAHKNGGALKRVKAILASGAETPVDIDFGAGQRVVTTISGYTNAHVNSVLLLNPDAPVEDELTAGLFLRIQGCCAVSPSLNFVNGVATLEGVEAGNYIVLAVGLDPSNEAEDERFAKARTGHTAISVREGEDAEVALTIR